MIESPAPGPGARLRPLGRPSALRVHTDAGGRPIRVLRRKGRSEAVVAVRETWRVDDEWWRDPVSRLYHEIVLADGRLLTLYRDLLDGSWYEQ